MRRALDGLYALSAGLAALALLGIFLVMAGGVAVRALGHEIPAADDVVAYLCVATTFFALGHAFRRAELIRVGMLIENLSPGARRVQEIVALSFTGAAVAYITWWTLQDALFSLEIEEVAQGLVAFPLWVPKMAMPIGSGILLVAILDDLVAVLAGRKTSYIEAAEARAARGEYSAER
ncbi:TRAP transporter small permease [Roseomonas sp. CCTCC AB2023176]|uniref:TRAP transporter small permease n=1 Tax=Roseomonas sp. CCTCC AB2023176 TaxID=3342640 RepID=UPI0035D7D62F